MKRFTFALIGALVFFFGLNLLATTSLPKGECDQVISHTHYTLCYSTEHRQALWTAHDLTLEVLTGTAEREDDFRPDPKISTNPVLATDYRGSGFDRGHMVPAGDMRISVVAMSESFFMSNMSPQNPKLNRGLWANLESTMRSWVRKFGDAWVVTAPVLRPGLSQLPKRISIPESYYKMIYIPNTEQVAAFLVPNKDPAGTKIWDYSIKISEVEAKTGLDFFSELQDELEQRVENKVAVASDF